MLPPIELYPWYEKIFRNGSSKCRNVLEKMDSRKPSPIEPVIKVIRRTCAKPEERWNCLASGWLCETLWKQIGTSHWNRLWQPWFYAIKESEIGTLRVEPASRDVSACILLFCFWDQKQIRRGWHQFKSATNAIRQHEITFQTEKSLFSQNSKILRVRTKICNPPILARKTWGER